MNKSDLTIEQSFEELEQILEKLEDPEITLEESFEFYEKGIRMVRACSEKIDHVEKRIQILQRGDEDGDA